MKNVPSKRLSINMILFVIRVILNIQWSATLLLVHKWFYYQQRTAVMLLHTFISKRMTSFKCYNNQQTCEITISCFIAIYNHIPSSLTCSMKCSDAKLITLSARFHWHKTKLSVSAFFIHFSLFTLVVFQTVRVLGVRNVTAMVYSYLYSISR